MDKNFRLFTALRFNNNTIREIANIQNQLINIDPKARFVKPITNFHETLYFIGMVPSKKLKNVEKGFKEACQTYRNEINLPIKINFTKLGKFNRSGGDIIWLGVEENYEMKTLANLIPNKLENEGIEVTKSNFKAHITLARKYKGPLPKIIELPSNIIISEAALVWSRRNENNILIYDNIVQYPLIK